MSKKTQLQDLAFLFSNSPKGVTSMMIVDYCQTVSPSKRISELRDRGWTITKRKFDGQNYHRFWAKPPKGGDAYLQGKGKR